MRKLLIAIALIVLSGAVKAEEFRENQEFVWSKYEQCEPNGEYKIASPDIHAKLHRLLTGATDVDVNRILREHLEFSKQQSPVYYEYRTRNFMRLLGACGYLIGV